MMSIGPVSEEFDTVCVCFFSGFRVHRVEGLGFRGLGFMGLWFRGLGFRI